MAVTKETGPKEAAVTEAGVVAATTEVAMTVAVMTAVVAMTVVAMTVAEEEEILVWGKLRSATTPKVLQYFVTWYTTSPIKLEINSVHYIRPGNLNSVSLYYYNLL